jgi:hypothetical protein
MALSSLSRRAGNACAVVVMLAGCGGGAWQVESPGAIPPNARGALQPTGAATTGNIFWNKHRLDLPYPTKPRAKATLTYWAPNGYFTYPVSCKRNGRISATPHHKSGNPSGYMHVVYWFKAQTPGPDDCQFTAVLSGTGSPPIAVIQLRIDRK